MKKYFISLLVGLCTSFLLITNVFAERVGGYYRDSDGDGQKETYVQPYERTSPNSSRTDNYSYPGNYNPNSDTYTPRSDSPRENYPYNPNPYERRR